MCKKARTDELLEDGRMIRHRGLLANHPLVPIVIEHRLTSFLRGRHLDSSFSCIWSLPSIIVREEAIHNMGPETPKVIRCHIIDQQT